MTTPRLYSRLASSLYSLIVGDDGWDLLAVSGLIDLHAFELTALGLVSLARVALQINQLAAHSELLQLLTLEVDRDRVQCLARPIRERALLRDVGWYSRDLWQVE